MNRADWLESLKPGKAVTLVVCSQSRPISYRAVVDSIGGDKITLAVSDGDYALSVWRTTGCHPSAGWYIRPLDAPSDYPNPLMEIEIDWSSA